MRIAVIGAGYVGLVSGACFAKLGHEVRLCDVDPDKVAAINSGRPTIFEPGLGKVLKAEAGRRLSATTSIAEAMEGADAAFICVGTPSLPSGETDLSHVLSAAKSIAGQLARSEKRVLVVVKSTVPPGTTEKVAQVLEKESGRKAGSGFGTAMNPEFLREGSAMKDAIAPDRIVIGAQDGRDSERLAEIYSKINCRKIVVPIRAAELAKYASNVFLACRVALANEVACTCEALGLDVDEVMECVGADSRIGAQFLRAGAGFGGSCFPKDVRSLSFEARKLGSPAPVMDAVLASNRRQQRRLFDMLKARMGVRGKRIAVLGLAFKEGTDDVRESPAIAVISALLSAGASVRAYDPQAMKNMRRIFPQAQYCSSAAECLSGADAALLLSDWEEFRLPAKKFKSILGDAPLFDARRVLRAGDARNAGLEYHCVGRGSIGGLAKGTPAGKRGSRKGI